MMDDPDRGEIHHSYPCITSDTALAYAAMTRSFMLPVVTAIHRSDREGDTVSTCQYGDPGVWLLFEMKLECREKCGTNVGSQHQVQTHTYTPRAC